MIADEQPPAALPEEPETQPAEMVYQIGAPYIGVWLRDDEYGTLALRLEEVTLTVLMNVSAFCMAPLYPRRP